MIVCPECKKEVSAAAAACPHCGCPLQPQAPAASEMVRMAGFTSYMRSPIDGLNGQAVLTDTRFVFGTGKTLKKMSAGALADIAKASAKGDIVLDIPLAAITAVASGKQGFSTLLVIETAGGNCTFAFMKKAVHAEWEAALKQAVGG